MVNSIDSSNDIMFRMSVTGYKYLVVDAITSISYMFLSQACHKSFELSRDSFVSFNFASAWIDHKALDFFSYKQ